VAEASEQADHRAVGEVNRAFYDAFEAADLDAMSDLWEHSDRVSCVHPGWAVLRGWGAVSASFLAIFQGPHRLQFILTEERVTVAGDTAWVTVDENIIGSEVGSTVTALNLFVREADTWRIVAHHGSSVVVAGGS
jgi:ketosteroid isomerase-like protein